VSHDLRAPLRIVNGFADILAQDYREQLDEEGRRLLDKIMNGARRMGILIDELIGLARFGRKEMVMQETDMNLLVRGVIGEFFTTRSEQVSIKTTALPTVFCDSGLIRQVWINLLSNGLKYSSRQAQPVVEVGFEDAGMSYEFFVRDNGVGFDMAFKDKLFGVFQRLHKKNEFEGTGIGLALVKSIVARHGGAVRAESEVGKGATFYFSLPKTAKDVS
jgi:light-regulated signal transduction histidine kinase (bacteriophytochrome)